MTNEELEELKYEAYEQLGYMSKYEVIDRLVSNFGSIIDKLQNDKDCDCVDSHSNEDFNTFRR